MVRLDADAERLWREGGSIPISSEPNHPSIAFLLADDQPLETDEGTARSLGSTWLQGHHAIAICHFLLDEGVELNL